MEVEGDIFDPYKHEVVLVEENDELPENTIVEELDKGYFLNNTLLKPARVKITKLKFTASNKSSIHMMATKMFFLFKINPSAPAQNIRVVAFKIYPRFNVNIVCI